MIEAPEALVSEAELCIGNRGADEGFLDTMRTEFKSQCSFFFRFLNVIGRRFIITEQCGQLCPHICGIYLDGNGRIIP